VNAVPEPTPPSSASQRAWTPLLLLALIVSLAAALRIYSLSTLGYWTDEFCTLCNAQGHGVAYARLPLDTIVAPQSSPTRFENALPWSRIVPGMVAEDSHPPLYIFIIRAIETAFGDGEAAVRSACVAFSLVAIALLYAVVREAGAGTTPALWACLLMAVAGTQIEFAQDANKFMPLMTWTLLAAWGLLRLRAKASLGAATLTALALLAMMMTHYFGAGPALGLALYALIDLRGRARRHAAAAFAFAGIVFLITWGPMVLRQRPNFTANYRWVADDSPGHVGRTLVELARVPARLIAETAPVGWLPIVTVVSTVILILMPVAFILRRQTRVWVVWFACAVGLIVLLDLTRGTLQLRMIRYSLAAAPPLFALLATAIPRGRWRFAPVAVAVVYALVRLPNAYLPPWKTDYHAPDHRTTVEVIARQMRPEDALVIASRNAEAVQVSYMAFQHYAPAVTQGMVATLTHPADPALLAQLRRSRTVWVVWLSERERITDWLPGLKVDQVGRLTAAAWIVEGSWEPRTGTATSTSPASTE
jgi:uncharacterized membrane protein